MVQVILNIGIGFAILGVTFTVMVVFGKPHRARYLYSLTGGICIAAGICAVLYGALKPDDSYFIWSAFWFVVGLSHIAYAIWKAKPQKNNAT